MKNIRYIFLFLGLSQFINSFSLCNCYWPITKTTAVMYGLENSNIAFLGELIYTDSVKEYCFRICEIYKGTFKKDTIYGKKTSECAQVPIGDGLWIIYANFNKDSTIEIEPCSGSISFKYLQYFATPPPPPIINKNNLKSDKLLGARINNLEQYNSGLLNWFNDLEKLRYYKLHFYDSKIVHIKPIIDYKLILLIISTIINISMCFIIIIRIKNKSQ